MLYKMSNVLLPLDRRRGAVVSASDPSSIDNYKEFEPLPVIALSKQVNTHWSALLILTQY